MAGTGHRENIRRSPFTDEGLQAMAAGLQENY
jgi:hypothetical protein